VLQIFIALKNPSPWPGSSPVASTTHHQGDWTKWHWDVFSQFFGFPVSIISPLLSNSYHLGDQQYVWQWQQFRDVLSAYRKFKIWAIGRNMNKMSIRPFSEPK
jgi:hypothetical protein